MSQNFETKLARLWALKLRFNEIKARLVMVISTKLAPHGSDQINRRKDKSRSARVTCPTKETDTNLTKTLKIQTLKQKIAAARRDLNAIWDAQGCTNALVLSAAAKLDELCNEYQRICLSESASRGSAPIPKPMAIPKELRKKLQARSE